MRGFGQRHRLLGFSIGRRWLRQPRTAVRGFDNLCPSNSGAFDRRDASDRLWWERRIRNCPGGATVDRLHDPGPTARVTDQSGWAGHGRQAGDACWRSSIRPSHPSVVGDDDGGVAAAVVSHRNTGGRRRRGIGCAGHRADIGQGRIGRRRLPAGRGRCRGSRDERAQENKAGREQRQDRKNGEGDIPNRPHGTSSVLPHALRTGDPDRTAAQPSVIQRSIGVGERLCYFERGAAETMFGGVWPARTSHTP